MNKKIVLTFILAVICTVVLANESEKHKYQSLFVYNFLKHINWPDVSDAYVIGVFKNDDMQSALDQMAAQKKQLNGLPIKVVMVNNYEDIAKCQLLFIPKEQSAVIEKIQGTSLKNSVIIVSEKEGLAKNGSDINFKVDEGKIRFEMNLKNIESKGIKVSSSLTGLAVLV